MDNLAVTISAGCTRGSTAARWAVWRISALFALAHFVMFSTGYEGGILVHTGRIVGAGVACFILVVIGVQMMYNAFGPAEKLQADLFTSFHTQLALAVATSLDALFVGAGMALSATPFWQTVLAVTGCVLFTSLCGFKLGRFLGEKFGPKMELIGGAVLVFLGAKVLLEAVGIW